MSKATPPISSAPITPGAAGLIWANRKEPTRGAITCVKLVMAAERPRMPPTSDWATLLVRAGFPPWKGFLVLPSNSKSKVYPEQHSVKVHAEGPVLNPAGEVEGLYPLSYG